MLSDVATSQIERYGSKGVATLIRTTTVYDENTMVNTATTLEISLLAYVGSIPFDQQYGENKWSKGVKIMAALDEDFDGVVTEKDRITIGVTSYDITLINPNYINNELAYVELICHG